MPASYGDRDQDQGLRRPILGSGGPTVASTPLGAVVLIPADPHHLLLQKLSESRKLALTGEGHGEPSSGDMFHAVSNSSASTCQSHKLTAVSSGAVGSGHFDLHLHVLLHHPHVGRPSGSSCLEA
uniref:Uncharacterized protein n=1 Tax=Pipistrellus kuhlii TaxID=59472 RepID=A0A7J7RFF8_PIPKU|nr:hypothetical protein mPipKuh1_010562 [Pipistrellus kuhlii]